MEKLIDAMADDLADYYVDEDASGLVFVVPHKEHWSLLKKMVDRIGKAYADGELELPGEVARLEQEPSTKLFARGGSASLSGWIRNRHREGARTFIALRKEEEK